MTLVDEPDRRLPCAQPGCDVTTDDGALMLSVSAEPDGTPIWWCSEHMEPPWVVRTVGPIVRCVVCAVGTAERFDGVPIHARCYPRLDVGTREAAAPAEPEARRGAYGRRRSA